MLRFYKSSGVSGVSPYHPASRVKQEVVTGPTSLSNSVSGTYKGHEGYYNFYNIGANDSPEEAQLLMGLDTLRMELRMLLLTRLI